MRLSRPKITIILSLAAAALLGVAAIIHDRVGAATDAAVARWVAAARKGGVEVILPPSVDGGGFPLHSRRAFAAPVLTTADGRRAASAELVVEVALTDPSVVTLTLVGPTTVTAAGVGAGDAPPITLSGGTVVTASFEALALSDGAAIPTHATAVMNDVTIPDGLGRPWRVARLTVTERVASPPPTDHRQPGLTLDVSAEGVEPPPALGLTSDGRATGRVTLMGAIPSPDRAALERWRVDGGALEVAGLEALFGGARLTGDGTVTLDRELQLEGAFTLRGEGVVPLLDRLADGGALSLTPQDFRRVRSAATLLTQPDPAGGPPRMTVPLFVQNRKVFAGPMMVAKLPPLRW